MNKRFPRRTARRLSPRFLGGSWLSLLSLLLLATAGCGKGDPYAVVAVSGTLTFEGKPVSGIRMQFSPAEGRPSIAVTDGKGKFRPLYRAGQYGVQKGKIQINFEKNDDGSEILGSDGSKPSKSVQTLLKLHGHGGTPVEIEITGATNDLVIALPIAESK